MITKGGRRMKELETNRIISDITPMVWPESNAYGFSLSLKF